MDSVIMTTPENTLRLKSRIRSAANVICARNSKHKSNNKNNITSKTSGRNGLTRNNSVNRVNSIKHNKNSVVLNNQDAVNKNMVNNEQQNGLKKGHLWINGKHAREVYNAWCERLDTVSSISSADALLALFNDIHLYPSKSQVYEMLHCARMCGSSGGQLLTFGQFCVFVGELKKHHTPQPFQSYSSHVPPPSITARTNKSFPKYQVFLGGSCNPTTWRADTAIPTLTKLGITYYNPQVSSWSPELMTLEHEAKRLADVLFFVLDRETRCVAGMVEVAQLTAAKRSLVVVAHAFQPRQRITGEIISSQEYLDLWHGQNTLLALIALNSTPVFSNLGHALQYTSHIVQNRNVDNDCEELHLSDKLIKLREAFDLADINGRGELTLNDTCKAYNNATNQNLSIGDLKAIVQNNQTIDNIRINFEQFCGIVAEFSNNSYEQNNTTEWANQPLQRQCSGNNNSNNCDSTDNHMSCTITKSSTPIEHRDIYLGGSSSSRSKWRQSIVIPMLNEQEITYYNSAVHEKDVSSILQQSNSISLSRQSSSSDEDMSVDDDLNEILVENVKNAFNIEADVDYDVRIMDKCKVLLFVITNETRSIAPILLAAHCIGLKKNVVLCVQNFDVDNCILGNEQLSKYAIKDYNRSRSYLADIARREGIPVFESVSDAVECAVKKSQQQW